MLHPLTSFILRHSGQCTALRQALLASLSCTPWRLQTCPVAPRIPSRVLRWHHPAQRRAGRPDWRLYGPASEQGLRGVLVRLWFRSGQCPVAGDHPAERMELGHHIPSQVGRMAGSQPRHKGAGQIKCTLLFEDILEVHVLEYRSSFQGLFSRITFREPVFLGGIGNITGLAKRLPMAEGFAGCIRRFVANEHDYKFTEHPLGDVINGFDIREFGSPALPRSSDILFY